MNPETIKAINKELNELRDLCRQLEGVGLTTIANRILVPVEEVEKTLVTVEVDE